MKGDALLVYDGECRLCLRIVEFLRSWDRRGRIVFVPYQNSFVRRVLPELSTRELAQAMVFLGPRGHRYRGADALSRVLRLLPGGLPLRAFFALPGFPALARRLYRWVAGHRHELGCALPHRTTA